MWQQELVELAEAVGLLRALTSRASRRRRSAWPALRRPRASSPTRAASRSGAWCAHCDGFDLPTFVRQQSSVQATKGQQRAEGRSQSHTQPKSKSQKPKAKAEMVWATGVPARAGGAGGCDGARAADGASGKNLCTKFREASGSQV